MRQCQFDRGRCHSEAEEGWDYCHPHAPAEAAYLIQRAIDRQMTVGVDRTRAMNWVAIAARTTPGEWDQERSVA